MVKCEQRFEIDSASNSGYPLDQNLYQTVKGMSAASKVVKKDGHIIMVSECADGFPDHGKFAEIFKMADTPQGILELIHNPNFKEVDQWQVQKQASIQTFANVHVYSELTDQQLKDSMLIPTSNIEHTIQELEHRYGRKLTIGVMPQGPLTIPYVEDKE